MDLGQVIIGLINLIGVLIFVFSSLLSSWEGMGLLILLGAIITYVYKAKDNLFMLNYKEILYFSSIFFLIWLGMGSLIGVNNSILANIFGKIIILVAVVVILSSLFILKREILN